MEISLSKRVALLLVLIFLMASCIIVTKPVLSATEVSENYWTSKISMPSAVSGLKIAVVNDKIHAIAGNTNYEYNPATDTWTAKKPMLTPR
jgi:hypothetical protein